MQRTIELPHPPRRIVSLVPSQTELLAALGLEVQVVGITKFCIHPERWLRTKTRVGGTKNLKLEKIRELEPDLIIGNKEENTKTQIEELSKHFPVWMSDVGHLASALDMIRRVGAITGTESAAIKLTEKIARNFSGLDSSAPNEAAPTVAYFIWNKPLMVAAGNTFIDAMIKRLGWRNAFEGWTRYPQITMDELQEVAPDYLLFSSEPFPFREKHLTEFRQRFSHSVVMLVNGEYFSWYGSRLLDAPRYFAELRDQLRLAPGGK